MINTHLLHASEHCRLTASDRKSQLTPIRPRGSIITKDYTNVDMMVSQLQKHYHFSPVMILDLLNDIDIDFEDREANELS